jgi:hypothetical protein
MPRKRRHAKLRVADLSPELVDVLLTGTSEIDPFLEFDLSRDEMAGYWQRFGPELHAEAKRRGVVLRQADRETS